jgi:uncharacterized protein
MSHSSQSSYSLILPVGTQVVSRVELKNNRGEVTCMSGAVGTIAEAPTDNSHSYQIKLPDGQEVNLKRHEFSIRKHFQDGKASFEEVLGDYNLYNSVIYKCIVGSRAYGLDREGSDTDRRGIYLPPANLQWSLYGVPEQLENHESQECYWELQKFLILALKANPNVLECLYTPLVEVANPIAEELLSIREVFLSKLVYQTYNSYVLSQFKKMEQDLRAKGEIRWKHAMHLIRLLLSGIKVLDSGFVPIKVEEHRDELIAIREQTISWSEVNAWRLSLHKKFDMAFSQTSLPERPNYEKANDFLIATRQQMISNY